MKNENSTRLRNLMQIVNDDAKIAVNNEMTRIEHVFKRVNSHTIFGSFLSLNNPALFANTDSDTPAVISGVQTNCHNVEIDHGHGNIDYVELETLSTEQLISIVEKMESITEARQIGLKPLITKTASH